MKHFLYTLSDVEEISWIPNLSQFHINFLARCLSGRHIWLFALYFSNNDSGGLVNGTLVLSVCELHTSLRRQQGSTSSPAILHCKYLYDIIMCVGVGVPHHLSFHISGIPGNVLLITANRHSESPSSICRKCRYSTYS